MESIFSLAGAATTIIGLLLFLLSLHRLFGTPGKSRPPKIPGSWPLIGHLHRFGRAQLLLHKALGSEADKHGPIFTIQLGVHQVLVVSNWELARECFTTNDKAFASRPKSTAAEIMGYNYALFALGPYGPYWRQVRKIVILELLSSRRLEMLRYVRESEVQISINEIWQSWAAQAQTSSPNGLKVDMKAWFGELSLNVIVRMLAGKRYSNNEEEQGVNYHKVGKEYFELLGTIVVGDMIPWLGWLDLGGHVKAMKRIAKDMDSIVEGWLEEHKRKRMHGEVKADEQDFMDVMLSILEGDKIADEFSGFDADTINKATCLSMLSASSDTTTVTLTWALSLLLNNPDVLKKAQEELDLHIGVDRRVKESDIKNLIYLQAIFKETMRLYPAAPLPVPHESMEDCTVGGFNIPKGTRLLVNLYKIHRDPRVWADPDEFRPERFLTSHKDVDLRGQNFELIPFGSGRRMCPGITMALQFMSLTLASLIHGFEMVTPLNEPVDMTQDPGLTNPKATPLDVLLTPRFPSNFYVV